MAVISKASRILTIAVFFLCVFPSVLAVEVPSPSPVPGEGQDLCAGTPPRCNSKCIRTDPVCGVNGRTYRCGCPQAACYGVKVEKLGFCEVKNGGSAPLSGQPLLLVHIVCLIVFGFSLLFGLF